MPYAGELDYYLNIPGCQGESQTSGATNQIKVNSFSFGGNSVSSVDATSGSSSGKVICGDLNLDLVMDKGGPLLFQGMTKGTHFATATLTGLKTAGSSPGTYFTLALTEAYVSSTQFSGQSSMPNLGISLSYNQITITYYMQSATGTLTSTGAVSYSRTTQVSS
jgi:type VI secretion system secreted protein Hcp